MIQSEGFLEILKGAEHLPTLPGIAVRILEAVRKEDTSLKEIADILSTDPPLSAKILKIINSPFCGLQGKITSVPHAVNLLGIQAVKNFALSFSLVRGLSHRNGNSFDYPSFWKHSLVSSITSRLIAHEVLPDQEEDASFLGLLHDLGILALAQCIPDQYSLVLREREASLSSYHEIENQVLGFSHLDVGGELLKTWGFPESFHIPVRFHHYPERLQTDQPELLSLARILHLSSLFTDFFDHPEKGLYFGLVEWYAKAYGLLDRLNLDRIVQRTQELTATAFPFFEMKMEGEAGYAEMIERARGEMVNLSSDFIQKFLEQQRQIEVLRTQVSLDGLTGLNNFQRLHELLDMEIHRNRRYGSPLTLVLADIDDFKAINDTHGHLAGDHVLKELAGHLKEALRKTDMVARYGGEEFALILPETDAQGGVVATERIRKMVASLRVYYEGLQLAVTMSFGTASLVPLEVVPKKELIRRADVALYGAKKKGKNCICVYDETPK